MNQDTVPNLYDFPAREYGIQGRWPSPDPAGLSAVHPRDPQTWNRYAYVRNNPLRLTDPTGAFLDDDSGGGGGGGGRSFGGGCDPTADPTCGALANGKLLLSESATSARLRPKRSIVRWSRSAGALRL